MTRRGYRYAVEWIALNDDAGGGASSSEIAGYVSTGLVADLFGKDQRDVALDVYRFRQKVGYEVGANDVEAD